ncbi:MAG: ribosome biogenesis GTPase Der, partial [Geminicoccaceae bacterium]
MSFTAAIVGRPNVGKSTLFNRLVGRQQALVDPAPGVTRDRIEGAGSIGHLEFRVIDTAGLAEGPDTSLEARLRRQTEAALAEADLALMLIDAKYGLATLDGDFARWLRRQRKPVILIANKCEGLAAESFASEAWALGLGAPVAISAQNGEGLADLAAALQEHMRDGGAPRPEGSERPLRLVVAGRPNVGKSSLINRLLQDERLLTGPEPGLTRDAVTIAWQWRERRIELIDTAGLRRKARVEHGGLENLSSRAALAALRRADVALLLVDARMPLEKQDLAIANRVIEAGSALVVAANKWDLVTEPEKTLALMRDRVESRLPQLRGLACLPVSVRTGKSLDRLPPLIVAVDERWRRRVPTSSLNRWLEQAVAIHAPPVV